MPQLSFRINAEWDKVQKLREEIAKLKQEIKGTDAIQSPHAFNTLNAKLVQTSQELGKVEGKIISTSAKMETDFKQKIYAASQGVNDFTEKIIAQKAVVKDVAADVKRLGDAYRDAKKYSPMSADGKLAEWKAAKRALEEEKAALFGLTQEQATARLSVKRLNDEYKAFRQEGGGTAQTMDLLTSKMKGIAATVMGGMGLKELASHIISVRAEFESMETSLKVLFGGNQERLNSIMAQIKEYALASPLNTKDMVGAVQMMTSFGIEAEKSIDYLKAIGDISMGDTGKFNSLALAFSQMSSAGKLMGQDLLQMVNAGFNPLEEISRKTGKSIGELKEEMSKGAITSKMVQDAFISVTSAGGKFYGMAAEGAKTLNGQISMLQESFDNMFNEIGSKGEGVVMTAVQTATKFVENYEQVGKILAGLVVTYGTYKTALILSTQATNGMTMAQVLHTTATKALTAAEAALNKTILANPYVLAAVALGTLITAVVLAGDSMMAAERAQDNYNKKIEENSKLVKDEKTEIDKLIGTLEDETSSIESKNIAFSTLIAKYPTIFGKYKTEKDLIDHLTEARQRENAEIERKTTLLGQKSYNESKTRATELNRLKYLQENGDIKGRQTQSGYKKGKDQDEYLRLWNKYHDDIKKTQTWYGTENGAIDRLASVATEEYKLNINENRKAQIAKYNANVGNLSKAQAQKELARLRSGLKKMDKSGKNYLKIGNNEPLSRAQIKERITLLENNVKTERKTMAQWRKEAEKETKKNRKAAKDLASSTELLTKDQAEKKMKAANDTLATSEKSEKNFDIQDKSGAKAAAKAERERKQQIKDANAHQKAVNDLDSKKIAKSQAQVELENQVEQSRIDALHEGSDKTLANMKLAHKKEMEQIDKQKEDYLKKKQEEAEAEFKANPKNKDKTFNRSTVTLSADEQAKFDKIHADTLTKHANEEQEHQRQQIDALNAYLKEYGSIQEKRLAIAKEYDEKIALAQSDGEHLSLQAQKAKALADFDINSQKQSMNWEDVFGNIDTFTKAQLENIKSQLRDMLSSNDMDLEGYKTAVDQIDRVNDAILAAEDKQKSFLGMSVTYGETRRKLEMDVTDALQRQADLQEQLGSAQAGVSLNRFAVGQTLQSAGISYNQRDITTANRGDILQKVGDKYGVDSAKYKEVQAALDKLAHSERDYNNVLQKKSKADQDALGKQSKLNKYLDDFAAKLADLMPLFAQINDNIQDIPGLLSTLGVSEDSSLGKGAAALADGANSTMSAMQDYLSGNYVGAAMNGIKAIGSYVQSATNLFAGAGNEKAMEAEIERLSKANESLSTAIDNLAEKISDSDNTNEQSVEAYRQAKKDEEEWEANQRKAINDRASEYTNSGHGFLGMGGKGSFNKHAKGSGWSGWYDFNAVLENIGSTSRVRNIQDFWKLSPEDMKELQASANAAWRALFDNDGYKSPEDLVNEYIERAGKLDELTDSLNEKITGYSWDSFKDGYLSMLEDLESSTADFADDINEKINNAILSALMNSEFKNRIESLYKEISDAAADDNLTEDEINSIKRKNEELASDMLKRRNDYVEMGLITPQTSSQKATANGVTEITYEQANNIVALATAGNITREQIKDIITLTNAKIDDFKSVQVQTKNIADELRTIQANSYIELQGIHEDTTAMSKAIKSMSSDVSDIKKKIKDM